jgi:hypothetical protein
MAVGLWYNIAWKNLFLSLKPFSTVCIYFFCSVHSPNDFAGIIADQDATHVFSVT